MTKHNRSDVLFQHPEAVPEQLALSHEVRVVEVDFSPDSSFALPVPKSMVIARPTRHVPQAPGRPMLLAVFGEPPALEGPRLGISTETLNWEVDPLEWMRWNAVHAGWRVALAQRHRVPSRSHGPCLSTVSSSKP